MAEEQEEAAEPRHMRGSLISARAKQGARGMNRTTTIEKCSQERIVDGRCVALVSRGSK